MTHRNLTSMIRVNEQISLRTDTHTRLTVSPLYHITGQVFSIGLAAACGETLVLIEKFNPEEVLRTIAQERCSHLLCMPTYYKELLDYGPSTWDGQVRQSLRFCATGGGPLMRAWGEEFQDRFSVPILTGYGLTEATGIVTWHNVGDTLHPGTVGRPVPHVKICIVNNQGRPALIGQPGEILIKSPGNMRGYHKLPQATGDVYRDGWLCTGDIGFQDDEGYVTLIGRSSGRIIRAEEHIFPAEIEGVLCEHPRVAQAAAFAIAHPRFGQDVKTLVVPKPGCHLTQEDLSLWIDHHLPKSKHPGIMEICHSLPMTSTGKVARNLLH
ncbi:MAG: fatty acid--CoA ligase family protein [Alphaproteobacteria bacterium]